MQLMCTPLKVLLLSSVSPCPLSITQIHSAVVIPFSIIHLFAEIWKKPDCVYHDHLLHSRQCVNYAAYSSQSPDLYALKCIEYSNPLNVVFLRIDSHDLLAGSICDGANRESELGRIAGHESLPCQGHWHLQ